ncbi:Copia protein, partial [Symbiodinium microadriaticum]
ALLQKEVAKLGLPGLRVDTVDGFQGAERDLILASTVRSHYRADDLRKTFRVEIEELKKRTQCRKCGRTGHWARECPNKQMASAASGSHSATSAGMVQHFVCHAVVPARSLNMIEALRARRASCGFQEILLVSSPGYAVLDSGCGKSVIGAQTLQAFRELWTRAGIEQPKTVAEVNLFRFGNGAQETSKQIIEMPVCVAGRRGLVRAAIISGEAPLLLSRGALKTLGARMDFFKDELQLFQAEKVIKMETNGAGQYIIPVAEFEKPSAEEPETGTLNDDLGQGQPEAVQDCWVVSEDGCSVTRIHNQPRRCAFTPCREGCPIAVDLLEDSRHTFRSAKGSGDVHEIRDNWRDPTSAHQEFDGPEWCGRTVFQVRPKQPGEAEPSPADAKQWTPHQWRQVRSAARRAQRHTRCSSETAVRDPDKVQVVELFTPPRFALEGITKGLQCVTADLITGWDFRRAADRDKMRALVEQQRPELLVLGPPCTWIAGWYELNLSHGPPLQSSQRGGRVLFECPAFSPAWKMPKWQQLSRRMHKVDLGLCKSRRGGKDVPLCLLVSHANMTALGKRSTGEVIDTYGPKFVKSALRLVREIPRNGVCLIQQAPDHECFVAGRVAEMNQQRKEQMQASLRRLHTNLGHPPNAVLIRVLKHGGANQAAIDLARELKCETCEASKQPKPAPLAQTHRVTEFNRRVGLDVKYLPGWMPNQKIPTLNIVDYASSFQVMVPLPGRETSEMIKKAFQERWVAWAGVPHEIVVDPAQTNLSDVFTEPQELAGAIVSATAAEAHWQLGKVEVHGGWFSRVLQKVIADCAPHDRETWLECVVAAHCKNELIQVYGLTPAQFVFGRNPRVPSNLLDEPLDVVPATASLYEASVARSVAVRQAARQAVVSLQDDKALRLSLGARPRVLETFSPGSLVAYWRTQKSHEGKIERGGRWYGPALVLGYVGKNLVVVHKRQVFRCAPEQVRRATSEEQALVETPNAELLGLKHLIDNQGLSSKQYIDLVPQDKPDAVNSPQVPQPAVDDQGIAPTAARASVPSSPGGELGPLSTEPSAPSRVQPSSQDTEAEARTESQPYAPVGPSAPQEPGYGPYRRSSKKGPQVLLHRPRELLPEDFAELMREVVPELVNQTMHATGTENEASSANADGTIGRGTKREASTEPAGGESERRVSTRVEESTDAGDEVLSVQQVLDQVGGDAMPIEVLLAQSYNKRQSKELPASGNPLELQNQVDEAKTIEWSTITGRNATRLLLGKEADRVRRLQPNRIMGSRFVVTVKKEEDAPARVKARWCLQGHLDPDLQKKALNGDLQSPTLSQVGRSVLFQLISTHRWLLRLGDIKGAFLSSGDLPQSYRPLYARLPPGGIPGVPSDALIEVIGHVYGLNDAPSAWMKTLNRALLDIGFERSRFDPCIYFMRDQGKLVGIYGVHVDDSATGGEGAKYEAALEALRKRFEFRKWRLGDGDFCGARYRQDPNSFAITMSQEGFVEKLRPLRLSRNRLQDKSAPLNNEEVRCLRAINGGLNWLATQSRPDLSTQVSFSQQAFPEPLVSDALAANNAIRRARQNAQLPLVFQPTPPDQLAVMCHSDAAYANGRDGATQAGYVVSFTHRDMNIGQVKPWTPAYWRSYRLPRVVNSTLSAEGQAMSSATGMLEWILLLLSEALDGPTSLRSCWEYASKRCSMVLTDCKSLYDHLTSKSAPTLDDKHTALDVVIVRESLGKVQSSLRWIPTDRMLADALTKETVEAMDLLRACIRSGYYQISDEDHVLDWRAEERQRRSQRSCAAWDAAWDAQSLRGPVSLTDDDLHNGIDILTRAMLLGEGDHLWNLSLQSFRERRAKYVQDGTWDCVCKQYRARHWYPEPETTGGTMADSSKRQRGEEVKSPRPAAKPDKDGALSPEAPFRSSSEGSSSHGRPPRGPPVPKPMSSPPRGPPPPTPARRAEGLPRDVQSVEEWGRTKIRFGKYASKNLTYADLVAIRDRESSSYIRWCMPRAKSGGEALSDLAKYLIARQDEGTLPSPCGSPAPTSSSTWARELRSPSSLP